MEPIDPIPEDPKARLQGPVAYTWQTLLTPGEQDYRKPNLRMYTPIMRIDLTKVACYRKRDGKLDRIDSSEIQAGDYIYYEEQGAYEMGSGGQEQNAAQTAQAAKEETKRMGYHGSQQQAEDLAHVAQGIAELLARKEKSYRGSWQKRGGVGAFMMLARKWDRIEEFAKAENYDIFAAINTQGFDGDGPLNELQDIAGYCILIINEYVHKKRFENYSAMAARGFEPQPDQPAVKPGRLTCPHCGKGAETSGDLSSGLAHCECGAQYRIVRQREDGGWDTELIRIIREDGVSFKDREEQWVHGKLGEEMVNVPVEPLPSQRAAMEEQTLTLAQIGDKVLEEKRQAEPVSIVTAQYELTLNRYKSELDYRDSQLERYRRRVDQLTAENQRLLDRIKELIENRAAQGGVIDRLKQTIADRDRQIRELYAELSDAKNRHVQEHAAANNPDRKRPDPKFREQVMDVIKSIPETPPGWHDPSHPHFNKFCGKCSYTIENCTCKEGPSDIRVGPGPEETKRLMEEAFNQPWHDPSHPHFHKTAGKQCPHCNSTFSGEASDGKILCRTCGNVYEYDPNSNPHLEAANARLEQSLTEEHDYEENFGDHAQGAN